MRAVIELRVFLVEEESRTERVLECSANAPACFGKAVTDFDVLRIDILIRTWFAYEHEAA